VNGRVYVEPIPDRSLLTSLPIGLRRGDLTTNRDTLLLDRGR